VFDKLFGFSFDKKPPENGGGKYDENRNVGRYLETQTQSELRRAHKTLISPLFHGIMQEISNSLYHEKARPFNKTPGVESPRFFAPGGNAPGHRTLPTRRPPTSGKG
jgi:hypothetical protein